MDYDISGLFEIHITVDTKDGLYNLWNYTFNEKLTKLILAVSKTGDYKEQYMISKWKNGTFKEVLDKTNKIIDDMKKYNIKILRSKIEAMSGNIGVPNTEDEFSNFILKNKCNPYFEYHAKIELMNNNIELLESWCRDQNIIFNKKSVYLGISINICGSKVPLLTIRVYNHGKLYSLENKNLILKSLKEQKFKINGDIQQEFAIYDTFEDMDKGWLI